MDFRSLLDLSHTKADGFLLSFSRPWEAVGAIGALICRLGEALDGEYDLVSPKVWVHRSALVAPTAYLGAPCIIGARTQVRHGAFVRGGALVGDDCVIGNSTELKNVILFDGVQAPHFNYAGDSILGYRAHLGAGAVLSNVRCDRAAVCVQTDGGRIHTGMKKLGAIVGDFAEIGCNSVLNPGTVIGRNAVIYPLTAVRGTVAPRSVVKNGMQPP